MNLLLTGATGFIGRNLLLQTLALKRYEKIYTLVRTPEKLHAQMRLDGFSKLPPEIKPVTSSAPDWEIPNLPVDHVVHSAGVMFVRTREEYAQVNVQGTLNLLSRLIKPKKIVILSSMAAGGPCAPSQPAKKEQDPGTPVTWYGDSKLAMERKVQESFPHLNYIFLRPPLVLGPRDQATLPLFRMAAQPVQFKPGFSPKHYSFISAQDLSNAILTALEPEKDWAQLPQRVFNVAAESPITDTHLLKTAIEVSHNKSRIIPIPQTLVKCLSLVVDSVPPLRKAIPSLTADRAKEIWPNRWVVSTEAFKRSFQWTAQESLDSTLLATRSWYAKEGSLRSL